jgi:RHS repeat-associated protein
VETYTYNAKDQLVSRDCSDSTPDAFYSYDGWGRISSLTNSLSIVAYTYDLLDRKLTEKQTVISTMKTVTYAYDADGRMVTLFPPSPAARRNYSYNQRGQLAAVTTSTAASPLATYSYNAAGELTALGRANALLSTYSRDVAGQLLSLAHTRNGNPVDSLAYTLDSMGRRTGITRPNGKNDSYGYDATGQVTSSNYGAMPAGATSETFAYDATGNRTSYGNSGNLPVPASVYTANNLDQYTLINGQGQTHDFNGNMTAMRLTATSPIVQMGWDAENRMINTETAGGNRIDNQYDALHRRILKTVSTWDSANNSWLPQKSTRFTYDAWNVVEEEETAGATVRRVNYTWGTDLSGTMQGAGGVGGLLRADEVIGTAASTLHYYWYDGNGNVVGLMRSNGAVDAGYRYTAFGGKAETSINTATFAARNPYRFSTKYLDAEVEQTEGTYYYGYRHYVAALGRWPSRDPIGEEGGVNLYVASLNSIVDMIDLLGLAPEKPDCCATEKNKLDEATDRWRAARDSLGEKQGAYLSAVANASWKATKFTGAMFALAGAIAAAKPCKEAGLGVVCAPFLYAAAKAAEEAVTAHKEYEEAFRDVQDAHRNASSANDVEREKRQKKREAEGELSRCKESQAYRTQCLCQL